MYFLLSKILIFALSPVFWVLAVLMVTAITKNTKRRKRFLIIAIGLLYFFSAPAFINLMAWAWSVNPPPVKQTRPYSCAIVLGGFASEAAKGSGYFNGSADRFIQGLLAYKTGKVTHILITGGNNSVFADGFKEGDWVKTQLNELKIPDSAVLIEDKARNTIENASFTKPILEKARLKPPYLLITSDFHMRRSAMIFKKQGYDVVLYPANYTNGNQQFSVYDLIPQGYPMGTWDTYLKEVVGYVMNRWL